MRVVASQGHTGHNMYPNWGGADHFHKASASFAWSIDKFRFIALQNYPTYRSSCAQAGHKNTYSGDRRRWSCDASFRILKGLDDGMEFLKKDLKEACGKGQYAILFFHDYGDHFCRKNFPNPAPKEEGGDGWAATPAKDVQEEECKQFYEAIKGTCVVAMVLGHIHSWAGNLQSKWRSEVKGVSG